jgi:hypothetical protein
MLVKLEYILFIKKHDFSVQNILIQCLLHRCFQPLNISFGLINVLGGIMRPGSILAPLPT